MPLSLDAAHDAEQLLDDRRRQAERQLVDHEQLRLGDERHAERQHLLLAAGEVAGHLVEALPQARERLEHVLGRLGQVLGVAAVEPAGGAQVLGDGERREHRLAAGHLDDAEPRGLLRVGVGDVAAVEEDGAADRVDVPLIAFSSVDLPAPFVPSSATISPGRTSMSTPKSTCTWS